MPPSDQYHAAIWQIQFCQLTNTMLPSNKYHVGIWQIPCRHVTTTLAPSHTYHVAIWQTLCCHLTYTIPTSDKYHPGVWQILCYHLTNTMSPSDNYHAAIWQTPWNNLTNTMHHLTNTMPPSDKHHVTIWQIQFNSRYMVYFELLYCIGDFWVVGFSSINIWSLWAASEWIHRSGRFLLLRLLLLLRSRQRPSVRVRWQQEPCWDRLPDSRQSLRCLPRTSALAPEGASTSWEERNRWNARLWMRCCTAVNWRMFIPYYVSCVTCVMCHV